MPNHLTRAAAVVVHPPIQWLQREPARRWPGHERVKPPSRAMGDLDDVPAVDALKAHPHGPPHRADRTPRSRGAAHRRVCARPCRRGRPGQGSAHERNDPSRPGRNASRKMELCRAADRILDAGWRSAGSGQSRRAVLETISASVIIARRCFSRARSTSSAGLVHVPRVRRASTATAGLDRDDESATFPGRHTEMCIELCSLIADSPQAGILAGRSEIARPRPASISFLNPRMNGRRCDCQTVGHARRFGLTINAEAAQTASASSRGGSPNSSAQTKSPVIHRTTTSSTERSSSR